MLVFLLALNTWAQDNPNSKPPSTPVMGAPAGGYVTASDNENNALSGTSDGDMGVYLCNTSSNAPIEFNIFITDITVTTAQLSIMGWDIDWAEGEKDEVYLNGTYIGDLTGINNTWSTSVFNVSPSIINPVGVNGGKNLVQIKIDQNNIGACWWSVQVNWGQLVINGSAGGNVNFRYVTLNNTQYCSGQCPVVTEEVDAAPSTSVRLETYLLDPTNNAIGQVNTPLYTATSGDEPVTISTLCLPVNPTAGTWKIQAICYDINNVQQDIKTVTFTVTNPCNPVPTMGQWGLILLAVVLLAIGTLFIMRRTKTDVSV